MRQQRTLALVRLADALCLKRGSGSWPRSGVRCDPWPTFLTSRAVSAGQPRSEHLETGRACGRPELRVDGGQVVRGERKVERGAVLANVRHVAGFRNG